MREGLQELDGVGPESERLGRVRQGDGLAQHLEGVGDGEELDFGVGGALHPEQDVAGPRRILAPALRDLDEVNAEGGPDRAGDAVRFGGEDGGVEGVDHPSPAEHTQIASLGSRARIGGFPARHLAEVLSVEDLPAQLPGPGVDGRRVRRRGGLRDGHQHDPGAGGHEEVLAVLVVVVADLLLADIDLVVVDPNQGIEGHVADARLLVGVPVGVPQVVVGDVDPRTHLAKQLGPRDHVPVVRFELQQHGAAGDPYEPLVLGEVEPAVRLEVRSGHHLRGRAEAGRAQDLLVGDDDPSPVELLPNQDGADQVVPGLVLQLRVLRAGDRFVLASGHLVVESAVDSHVLVVEDRLPVDPPHLAPGAGGLAGDVHPPLEEHQPREGQDGEDHDPLRVPAQLLHHGCRTLLGREANAVGTGWSMNDPTG